MSVCLPPVTNHQICLAGLWHSLSRKAAFHSGKSEAVCAGERPEELVAAEGLVCDVFECAVDLCLFKIE